jgi:hypothetical protein
VVTSETQSRVVQSAYRPTVGKPTGPTVKEEGRYTNKSSMKLVTELLRINFLFHCMNELFPGSKAAGRDVDHSSPSIT